MDMDMNMGGIGEDDIGGAGDLSMGGLDSPTTASVNTSRRSLRAQQEVHDQAVVRELHAAFEKTEETVRYDVEIFLSLSM